MTAEAGGFFAFGAKDQVTFANLSSELSINGIAFALEGDIKSLAGAIADQPRGAFALAADYDASGDGVYSASPVPTPFAGSFEGLGNRISNLAVDDPRANSKVGLFAKLSGTIRDIGLQNVRLAGGNGSGDGGEEDVGGLVGYVGGGAVIGSHASGSVSAGHGGYDSTAQVGGLIGLMAGGSTTSSYATARVSGGTAAGGLIGSVDSGTVTDSYATGSVQGGKNSYAGGLVGDNDTGTIEESFATGRASVSGSEKYGFVGGLVGDSWGAIVQSYSSGNASGTAYGAGGMAGFDVGTILQSYSTGSPTHADATYIGGLIGDDAAPDHAFARTYWDTTTSGISNISQGTGNFSNIAGMKGKTTRQLQAGLPKGFNPHVWAESPDINGGLPYLIANPSPR